MSSQISLVKAYIKDRRLMLSAYVISTLMLIVYYYLESNKSLIILYPALLAGFILLVFGVADFFSYARKYQALIHLKEDNDQLVKEEDLFFEVIKSMSSKHRAKELQLQNEYETQSYLLSQWIHNMKTPVSVIDLIIQKLELAITDNEQIGHLRAENQKLNHKLDQMLTLKRLSGFQNDFEPQEIDLVQLIKSLINENKQLFIYKQVFPKFDEQRTIKVLSDDKWLRIMLNQVITNGIKYRNSSEVAYVNFHIEVLEKEVVLNISDNGIGIQSYDMSKLFEPFFTGENGRQNHQASGIGLYITKQISDKLHHPILIESTVGEGTTVKIRLLTRM